MVPDGPDCRVFVFTAHNTSWNALEGRPDTRYGCPAARYLHSMTSDADANDRLLLFGGITVGSDPEDPKVLGDLWEWHLSNASWHCIYACPGAAPPAAPTIGVRFDHAAVVLDGVLFILYGRTDSLTYPDDVVWRFDPALATWAVVPPFQSLYPQCVGRPLPCRGHLSAPLRVLTIPPFVGVGRAVG